MHLILSDFLGKEDLARLNSLNALFEHMCKMIKHMKPQHICELFEHDKNYASQEKIPFKRRMQFLFLALINKLQMPEVIRSLKVNYNALLKNPDKILAKCKKALYKDLL